MLFISTGERLDYSRQDPYQLQRSYWRTRSSAEPQCEAVLSRHQFEDRRNSLWVHDNRSSVGYLHLNLSEKNFPLAVIEWVDILLIYYILNSERVQYGVRYSRSFLMFSIIEVIS